ncbi:MAG: hypothetical protein GXO28_04640 [Methanopyri archaeon]|nr:hypothetical protein [Methanopyri archaeon]
MPLRAVSFSADISDSDVRVPRPLLKRVARDLKRVENEFEGVLYARLGPVCGDDLSAVYVVEEDHLEDVNRAVFEIFRKYGGEDVGGVSEDPEEAGEGPSYAEAGCPDSEYQDLVVALFDTYAGENRVQEIAELCDAALDPLCYDHDVSGPGRRIPGVGYVGEGTDDPTLIATTSSLDQVGPCVGCLVGVGRGAGALPVERCERADVLPGTVMLSVVAVLNGNVVDAVKALKRGCTGTERFPLRYL